MKFKDAASVEEVVFLMKEADKPRSQNRANINRLFNGDPPFTEQEAIDNSIQTNVNFLEGTKIAHDARRQFNNAFLKPGNYFSITVEEGPVHKKSEWGRIITRQINRCMKRSLPYVESNRSVFANVVLHGPGPVNWEDKHKWCPTPLAIPDLLVPSNTRMSFDNLNHFAIFREWTPGKLYRMTHGPKVDPGWNMALVSKTLKKIAEEKTRTVPLNIDTPEKLAEQFKANLGYYESDAVPTIDCWDFYFRDDDDAGEKWNRRIVLDIASEGHGKKEFLYQTKRPYATGLSQMLHVQYGDGANVAPFLYHSVRSLGFMLYAVCDLQNRLRCRFNDSVFEQMLWYFRVNSPEDRDRLQKIDLHHMGIIPEGMQFVTAQERFVVKADLVTLAMQQNRQNMGENSASFVQDVNDGTNRPMTATETMARVNSGNALVSAMLTLAYNYETFKYLEIARRFCLKNSSDKDVQKFQEACLRQGVPQKVLNVDLWNIEPERVLGAGNKMLEVAQADKLMAVRNLLDPDASREVLHIYVEANTDDPQMAARLVPIKKQQVSDATHDAELSFATLMQGIKMQPKTGLNHIDFVEALLGALTQAVQKVEARKQRGGMITEDELIGFQTVATAIQQHIDFIAQDDNEKQRVKAYTDALAQIGNLIKASAQQLEESMADAAQQNGGPSPEAMAKLQESQLLAQNKARIKEGEARQKMAHKDAQFKADLARKEMTDKQQLATDFRQHQADLAATDLTTQAKIVNETRTAKAKAKTATTKKE